MTHAWLAPQIYHSSVSTQNTNLRPPYRMDLVALFG